MLSGKGMLPEEVMHPILVSAVVSIDISTTSQSDGWFKRLSSDISITNLLKNVIGFL